MPCGSDCRLAAAHAACQGGSGDLHRLWPLTALPGLPCLLMAMSPAVLPACASSIKGDSSAVVLRSASAPSWAARLQDRRACFAALPCIDCIVLHCTALLGIALCCLASHCAVSHCAALSILHCIALRCMLRAAFHRFALPCAGVLSGDRLLYFAVVAKFFGPGNVRKEFPPLLSPLWGRRQCVFFPLGSRIPRPGRG